MLIAAVDVFYRQDNAKAVCVLFAGWAATTPLSTHVAFSKEPAPYEPGSFYKRELPPLLKVLEQVDLSWIDVIVVDGYVFLDDTGRKGLGAYLYEGLEKRVPVMGVAKSGFPHNKSRVAEVFRGESRRPLFVSAVGIDLRVAAERIKAMAGQYRVPDMLRYLDRQTKEEKNHPDSS